MNEENYTGLHTHPSDPTLVEIVAYERRDRSWDVFVYEPKGSVPELEDQRVDEQHIFVTNIKLLNDLNEIAARIERQIGNGYAEVLFYREAGGRLIVGKVYDHLRKAGAIGMSVRASGESDWELWLRKKDVPLAEQVALSNV